MTGPDPGSDGAIPPYLHSTQKGRPFDACVQCGCSVLSPGTLYAIEKVQRHGEVVFEYAICLPCVHELMERMSEQSLERLQGYFHHQDRDSGQMVDDLLAALGQSTEDGLAETARDRRTPPTSCHRCGAAGGTFEERTVVGYLIGDRLIGPPMALCGACGDGMDELLSRETRDVQDDFIQQNFPGVPAGLELPVRTLGF